MYVTEGTWYKNNTLWRTILDLNHIIRFADKSGNIRQECQRTILHLGDMIISGEKEGPLAPSPKEENITILSNDASFNGCLKNIFFDKLQPFEASRGWKGYIEIPARKSNSS